MRFRTIIAFPLLCCLPFVLAACVETTSSTAASKTLVKGTSSGAFLREVSRNSRKVGARTERYGNQAAVVTYKGSPRGFITCTQRGSSTDVSKGMKLDTRTKVIASGQKAKAETLYIVTAGGKSKSGKRANTSAAFSNTQSGRFAGGITCRSTGKLEQTLLGQG